MTVLTNDIKKLIAFRLKKETFVRVVSTMYFIGSFPLYGSLMYYGLGTINDLYFSLFLIIPALIGQQVGSRIRHKISENMFRIFVLIILYMKLPYLILSNQILTNLRLSGLIIR